MWGSAAHTLANTSSTGIDSANILINYIFKNEEYKVRGKYDVEDDLIAQVKLTVADSCVSDKWLQVPHLPLQAR